MSFLNTESKESQYLSFAGCRCLLMNTTSACASNSSYPPRKQQSLAIPPASQEPAKQTSLIPFSKWENGGLEVEGFI